VFYAFLKNEHGFSTVESTVLKPCSYLLLLIGEPRFLLPQREAFYNTLQGVACSLPEVGKPGKHPSLLGARSHGDLG
jgi:hypothetical protein